MEESYCAVERAARDSYGRLIAFLSARSRDVAAAEDALADAFKAALETWPRVGVPKKPEAWLLVTARRRLMDQARHERVHALASPDLLAAAKEAQRASTQNDVTFPDERLKLMFICAHPAIAPAVRAPLMLQTVLGLDSSRIASPFLVQPSAMGRRLTRTKVKIRDAGITFELPEVRDLAARLDSVLDAIYAAYGSGWDDVAGSDPRRKGLAAEAIELGRILLRLMSAEPEVQGLLSLMLHCEARREARRDALGSYVPLTEQNTDLWSAPLIEEAERYLEIAARAGRLGHFQLEASIQSAHAQRARTGHTDWETIALLYEGLVRLAPTIGALVGRAAAVAEVRGAATALGLIEAIPIDAIRSYQPYWALAARLLKRLERDDEARGAYIRAIGLCEDEAVREFLRQEAG